MFNIYNKKAQRKLVTVVAIILILAMVVPLIAAAL